MTKDLHFNNSIHIWVPNLFEFKGGIQAYLCDFLTAIECLHEQGNITLNDVLILDKLDSKKPESLFKTSYFSFKFTGQLIKTFQTSAFTLKALVDVWQQRPGLIVCGHLNFAPVAYLLYRFLGVPYWILVYGVDAWNIEDSFRCRALRAARKVISISGYTRDRLIQEQDLPPKNISLLPVTFNTNRFQIKPKPSYLLTRHGLKTSQPVILTVARLADDEQYKGYDQVIRAIPLIRQKLPDIHYVLVGKGSDRPRIEQLIEFLGLKDHVTLAGFVPDEEICDYYNLCDVFIMPSKGEGFGIVYLEALACGKPTVGGNQDGAIDALCSGELGILVNPDNTEEIAATLVEILQGKSTHPILYQPEILRQKIDEIYGFKQFQINLLRLLNEADFAAL
ncbi:glycosyltransferase [Phormidium tenue]|uniref:Glycosyltransferase n=2 Tax=Phormidium tenue TaxID=126344 RepID=A0A1U7JBU7_9CYAN|nr:glycosyltransferase [Phormidium tenue]MBD2230099.1 glycosyltransferase [Phormidium tenue FACHB-1052]OKH51258.1 glycosyltransferase [Phormidium tenue NIES-30]